ncbi:MAG: RusA family crossover junction endodeoxyribonuclease [Bacteroidota bacterium]|nr:RusA family crossover junction endodeoxyribonuclease [Bacteroidota bacterium]
MAEVTYYQNPDFDEIFVFHGLEVPTSKKEFKPIAEDIQLKIAEAFPEICVPLYRKGVGTRGAQDFMTIIKDKLIAKRKKRWPYKQKLLLSVGVSGIKKVYGAKDLDNLLKSVFDAFKGIVFEDDNQIEIVIAFKHILFDNNQGFTVALRILENDTINKYIPKIFSNDYRTWGQTFVDKYSKSYDEEFSSFEIY